MKKILMTGLFLLISNFVKGASPYRKATLDLTKLKIAMGYVQSVKIFRLLFINLLGCGLCLIFLLTGLVLVHITILFYAPWDIGVKTAITLLAAAFYILTATGIFSYVFAEEQWLKIFNADQMVDRLTGSSNGEAPSREAAYSSRATL